MRMMRGNIERIAETPEKIMKLKADGYIPMEISEAIVEEKKTVNLQEMNTAELKEAAKEKGLTGYSSLTKDQLLEVLKDVI